MSIERKRLLWVWSDMRQRCRNPKHKAYVNYGARGIRACPEWESFAAFCADMGPRPQGGLLDRIDNNGHYEPANCRWATRKEQNSNRRNCIYVQCDGEMVTLREYCRRKELPYRPIAKRIANKWPMDAALSIPVGTGKHFGRAA